MTAAVVVDASIAIKWLVEEDHSGEADQLLIAWDRDNTRVTAPHLLPTEVANGLYQRVRRGHISLASAVQLEAAFLEKDIALVQSAHIHLRAMRIASALAQNAVYDAHYLALAEALDCELWTADQRFYQAAADGFSRVHFVGEI